ncbi:MAG: hypothetical protein JNK25_13805 [Phycisphaerae bacterium]|nr:hypothetical protein [Phycisphaerae bacterium]
MSGHEHTPAVHDHADAWHHHDATEGMPQREHAGVADPMAIARWFTGILIVVVGLIIILSVYFVKYTTQMRHDRIETFGWISKDAATARAQAEARLGMTGGPFLFEWSDAAAGTVQLPIEQAMSKVVSKYADSVKPAGAKKEGS